jgi:hypothetical protein
LGRNPLLEESKKFGVERGLRQDREGFFIESFMGNLILHQGNGLIIGAKGRGKPYVGYRPIQTL